MNYIDAPQQLSFLLKTCEVVQRLLDLQTDDDEYSLEVESYLESDVKKIFEFAELVLSNLWESDRKLKKVFYVVYMLKRFDPKGEFVRIKLQQCPKEEGEKAEEAVFLRVVWHFDQVNIATTFDSEGCPDSKCNWNEHPAYHIYDVFVDIECLSRQDESPQNITAEMTQRWNVLKALTVREFRF